MYYVITYNVFIIRVYKLVGNLYVYIYNGYDNRVCIHIYAKGTYIIKEFDQFSHGLYSALVL